LHIISYQVNPRQTLSFAYGLYGKILPMAGYFYTLRDTVGTTINESFPNKDLPIIKANHFILSYNYALPSGLKFSAETYYQNLFNVPIDTDANSLYWMLNTRSSFPERPALSDGRGENYGIDLSVEKFFSNRFYFLITGSFFKSYFYPKNGERYATTFANDYVSALTMGREFEFKKDRILQIGGRFLYNGGNRYTPVDEAASIAAGQYIGDVNLTNTERIPDYIRLDTRIAWSYNARKIAGRISLDIQNVLNRKNPNNIGYDAENNELFFRNHTSGLVPVLSLQFDF